MSSSPSGELKVSQMGNSGRAKKAEAWGDSGLASLRMHSVVEQA